MTDKELLLFLVAAKVKKNVRKHGELLQSIAFANCGKGLTAEDFEQVVQSLLSKNICTRSAGPKGGLMLKAIEEEVPVTQE